MLGSQAPRGFQLDYDAPVGNQVCKVGAYWMPAILNLDRYVEFDRQSYPGCLRSETHEHRLFQGSRNRVRCRPGNTSSERGWSFRCAEASCSLRFTTGLVISRNLKSS